MSYIRKELLEISALEEEGFRDTSFRLVSSQRAVTVILFGGLLSVMGLIAFLSRYHLTLLAKDFTKAQSEMRRNEEIFRFLAKNSSELIWIAAPDGHLHWLNESWGRYFGISREQPLTEIPWKDFLKGSELNHLSQKWFEAVLNKKAFQGQVRLKGKDGHFRLFEYSSKPILDENGEVLFHLGTCVDIEEQENERIEKEFQIQANDLLRNNLDISNTLESISGISVPLISDWSTISFFDDSPNQNLRYFSSKHRDRSKEQNLAELKSTLIPLGPQNMALLKKGDPLFVEKVTEAFLFQYLGDHETAHKVWKLGLRSLAVLPIYWGEKIQGVILFVWTDEDPARRSQGLFLGKKLARLASMALRSAALHEQVRYSVQVRDDFISMASHEIKTPLTSLSLQIQLLIRSLQREPHSDLKNQKALSFCLNQISRLDKLLDDLLDITRIEQNKLSINAEKTDLSSFLETVCRRFEPQAHKMGIALKWEQTSPTLCFCDPHRLEQVMTNLLSNAFKYGNSKPIVCKVMKDTERKVAQLIVEDQGIGISPAMQQRIFERFQRASSLVSASGLGLGLYISKMLVEAHGGTIKVESKVNVGSRFTVTLPLSDEHFYSL